MFVLTIVFMYSQVSLVSLHASQETCEVVARRALAFAQGAQAVASARCAPEPAPPGPR